MNRNFWKSCALTLSVAGVFGVVLGEGAAPVGAQADPAASAEFYTTKVQPILQENCYKCHGGTAHKGGLYLGSRAGMLKGGHDGAVIVPGDPANSLLIKLIRHEGPPTDPMPMPPKGKLSDADIATITQWVKAGAVTPPDEER